MKFNSKILILILVLAGVNQLKSQNNQTQSTTRLPVTVVGETSDMSINYLTKWISINPESPTIGNSLYLFEEDGKVNVGKVQASSGPVEILKVNGKFSLMDRVEFTTKNAEISWGKKEKRPGDLIFNIINEEGTRSILHMIGDNGQVGIGTSNPISALDVEANGGQNIPSIVASSNADNKIFMVPLLGEGGLERKSSLSYLSKDGDAGLFWTDHITDPNGKAGLVIAPISSTSAGMRIDYMGNVGIGIKNPMSKLHVKGKVRSTDMFVENRTTTSKLTIFNKEYPPQDGFVLVTDVDGNASWTEPAGFGYWQKNTNNENDLYYKDGNVGIGTINTYGYRLAVDGKILTDEVMVKDPVDWFDGVFEPDYNLMTINELEMFINSHGHLPDVPSEETVMENGYGLADMNGILLKKVEELTLYIIEIKKAMDEQNKVIELQQDELVKINANLNTGN